MKRINVLLVIALLITVLAIPFEGFAADDSIKISIDGKIVGFSNSTGSPFVDTNGRTQVPFRTTLEAFGAKVGWNQETKTATTEKDGIKVEVPIDKKYIFKNGQKIETDTEALLKDGKTYLPIRSVIEALGGTVTWDNTTKTVALESNTLPTDKYPERYNTQNLRVDAKFRTKIDDNIYWVPVNTLGSTDYTNEEILRIEKDPLVLSEKIDTLYELIQYIQNFNIKTINGNPKTRENSIEWEHTRSVKTTLDINSANCLSISNFAVNMLKGDYDEVGFIEYGEERGGHIFNYIKENGKYYVFDLTSYKTDFLGVSVETGIIKDYHYKNSVGNVHEVESLEEYMQFYKRECRMTQPVIFITYTADKALSVGTKVMNNVRYYCFAKDSNITILYDSPNDSVNIEFVNPPTAYPKEYND